MVEDLSKYHRPIGTLLDCGSRAKDWDRYRLNEEQLEFFQGNGYLKGIRILSEEQVEVLRGELEQLMNPEHPGRHLFHEYHSNESTDPERVLFHALEAWRGIRIIPTGQERRRWPISLVGLGWTIRHARMDVCIMFPEATSGRTCPNRFWQAGWKQAAAVCRKNCRRSSGPCQWK